MRRVEREASWLELVDRRAVVRAGVALAVAPLLERRAFIVAGGGSDQDDTLTQP
jgi:hypothetical protein